MSIKKFSELIIFLIVFNFICFGKNEEIGDRNIKMKPETNKKVLKSEEEWKEILTPEQYNIMRQQGTENPFSGKYWGHKEKGKYNCAACGAELFLSDDKFESKTGWPSFTKPTFEKNIGDWSRYKK